MKLELKHIIDNDNQEWYVVVKDDNQKKWFSVLEDGSNREEKLKNATEYFHWLKVSREPEETIILTEII